MEWLVSISCCVAFIIIGNFIKPFHSPYQNLKDAEFTLLINGLICFLIGSSMILILH